MKKNSLGQESNMEYEVESSVFWKNMDIYDHALDWHLGDERIQKITKKKLGIKYIDTIFSQEINHPYHSKFLFKILDKKKFLWAKIKYGI